MRLLSCHHGQLQTLLRSELAGARAKTFRTGLAALDDLLPEQGFPCGAVHEVLTPAGEGSPLFFAALLARAAAASRGGDRHDSGVCGAVAWCDPHGRLYPPALAAAGVPLERVLLVRPGNQKDEVWAVVECLRCPGVSATVASPQRLSRTEARRLQLAAEAGGGVGILMRREGASSAEYAAATRWKVRGVPGERVLQRWELQLVHCHGGQVGRTVMLEACREASNTVRAVAAVGGRSGEEALAARRRRA